MDLTNISEVKNILKAHRLWAKKRLGQHFLISKSVLKKIIQTSELKKDDIVLEIGPGIGTLTQELLKRAKKVIAIEKDPLMAEILKTTTQGYKNLEIVNEDILKFSISNFLARGATPAVGQGSALDGQFSNTDYKIVANLPYNITSAVLRKFLESERKPQEMILMVQKEVAQRIVAKPGKMSILAVSVQFYAEPEIVSYVSKDSFWPKPEVDSAIIKISPRVTPLASDVDAKKFFRVVKIGFSSPRKQLHNNIAGGFKLTRAKAEELLLKADIVPQNRAEDLSLKDWVNLYNVFYAK